MHTCYELMTHTPTPIYNIYFILILYETSYYFTWIQSKTIFAKFGVNCHTWFTVNPAKSTNSTVPATWVLGSRMAASITSWTPRYISVRVQFFTFHLSIDMWAERGKTQVILCYFLCNVKKKKKNKVLTGST